MCKLEIFTFHVAGSENRGNKHFTVHELLLKMGCILQGVAKIVLLVFYDHVHTLLDKFLNDATLEYMLESCLLLDQSDITRNLIKCASFCPIVNGLVYLLSHYNQTKFPA